MAMETRTEEIGTYGGQQQIQTWERDGWAVRQIVPIMESDTISSPDTIKIPTFTTKIWVVMERERESGWVQSGNRADDMGDLVANR